MKTLASFKNIHQGKTIIVCGCGESLNELTHPEHFITIGVNDVGRRFHPDYLVVVNPRSQFSGDRFYYVETSQAKYLFTQLDLNVPHQNVVKFRLGKYGGTDFSDPNILHYTQNSPYVALCLAVHMGAKCVGLIGVDFTDHHFFGKIGRHPLVRKLARIDAEYRVLGEALSKQGIEVINLSKQSRLTAFNKGSLETIKEMKRDLGKATEVSLDRKYKIFFVHYKFLSCGDVFREGLNHAAEELGVESAEAHWDDQRLSEKVRQFNPDLLFVVHGRRFCKKWGRRFQDYNTAVWLLDEPYEVDDTCKFSGNFNTVFVNDPNTIYRHKNAHYLPVCFDPHIYFPTSRAKKYDVGFIGGYNSVRQNLLESLQRQGLLSYIVGGPWKGKALNRICISPKIPASETANLYKQTKIVINIFREVHHFNKEKIPAFSLNPRVYEALACGALVVSENRPEVKEIFPELPVFEDAAQLEEIIEELLNDKIKYESIQKECYQRLGEHTYLDRLKKIIRIALEDKSRGLSLDPFYKKIKKVKDDVSLKRRKAFIHDDWEDYGNLVEIDNDIIILRKANDHGPGTERGLVSKRCYSNVDLSFEVNIKSGSCFIAKIHQVDKFDQMTNSYHLMCIKKRNYFARHHHIFKTFNMNRNSWEKVKIIFNGGILFFYRNDHLFFTLRDKQLKKGYAFIGIKSGEVLLRNIMITDLKSIDMHNVSNRDHKEIDYKVFHDFSKPNIPTVSIITTVYDRIECLRNCIKSVQNLTFEDYEHIIVADSPLKYILRELKNVVKQEDIGKIKFVNLKKRYNNWGIMPASVGIRLSRGRYICFLSDDNGYTPDHIGNLVEALESNPNLGFVYSSCRYDGRRVLNCPVPRPGGIDLGQPMFRRELFKLHFRDTLPFNIFSWDWHMINHFMKKGVQWKHINKPSFLFKLEKYPQFMASKNKNNPLASISILCHNNLKYTIKCIESILAKTKSEFELLITDNCSTDNTYQYLQSINDSRVTIYRNNKNIGFIKAHNEALKKAKGVYFIAFNNDLLIRGNWLERMIDCFDDPAVKVVGPIACQLDTQGRGYMVNNGKYDYIEGCCLAIETNFAREIGLFSNEFEFMYCEDSDLSLRVRAMGYKIKKIDCKVLHLRGLTTNRCVDLDIQGYWVKNHYILREKWKKYIETKSFEEDLVIKRTSATGDVFLLSPIIEYLKKENVHLRIHIITQSPQLLEGNPLIEGIWKSSPRHAEILDLDGAYEKRPTTHIVDAYAQELGIKGKINRQPRVYLNKEETDWADKHCKGEYIVVYAGQTNWPGRQVPITTLIQVVEILKKRGHKIIEIGHVKNLPNADQDFIGCTWKQSAGIIKNSLAYIGIDSAPMHIAQAFDKPGAVVFGCINPEYRLIHPEILRRVLADVGCKFCHHWQSAARVFSDCLRNDAVCMNKITPDQIIVQFDQAMEIVTASKRSTSLVSTERDYICLI